MCVYIYIYIYVYTCVYIYIYMCTPIYIYIYTYIHYNIVNAGGRLVVPHGVPVVLDDVRADLEVGQAANLSIGLTDNSIMFIL